jgi:CheY-like chemotaxis protein
VTERRAILRAELRRGARRVIAHTVAVDPGRIVVETDEPAITNERYDVELSFRGLFTPLQLEGSVVEIRERARAGDFGGLVLRLDFRDEGERNAYADLIAKLDAPRVESKKEYRVLLVEDNELIRDMFAYGLRRYFSRRQSAVNVDYAHDSAEAWSMHGKSTYDLAIVDYYLPGQDGSRLVDRMRREGQAAMPIVGISVGGAEARKAFLDAGADIFLDKPLTLRDLLATLDGLAAGEQKERKV